MRSRTPNQVRTQGFTLLELMIAVAIVGVLATVAMFAYTKYIRKARSSEVPAMFAEFRLKQEQFHAENGTYMSTGADDTDYHPASPAGPDNPNDIAPLPQEWIDLRINTDKAFLYCSYVAIAGDASDATNIGAKANDFNMTTAPATNWFYLIAECDLDSDPTQNSFYFARSDLDGLAKEDDGR